MQPNNSHTKSSFTEFIKNLQNTICEALEAHEPTKRFRQDVWNRPGGGGGRTRVLADGQVIEKGGVNISEVHGELPPTMQKKLNTNNSSFFACGLSLVIHPQNPFAPTVHANIRYFELYAPDGQTIKDQWFGGGIDLTPYYLFNHDAVHFHATLKKACDPFGPNLYAEYKKECDQYFRNHHRNEGRGIGGVFFDYLRPNKLTLTQLQDFTEGIGAAFIPAYEPILANRKNTPFAPENRKWQEIRRGRYVEFNLVHDRGTLFGLHTGGRTESILMSLPPTVQFVYDHHPKPNTPEADLLKVLINPKNWI